MKSLRIIGSMWLALMMGSCADGVTSFRVGGLVLPDTACTFGAMAIASLQPILDIRARGDANAAEGTAARDNYLRFPMRYFAGVRVQNGLLTRGSTGFPLQTNPNNINVESIDVQLADVSGALLAAPGLANPFRVAAFATVLSGATDIPGEAILGAEVVPQAWGDALTARFDGQPSTTLRVTLRVNGVTSGGIEVQSPPFEFPLQVCTGCLDQCTFDEMGELVLSSACLAGQDRGYSLPGLCEP